MKNPLIKHRWRFWIPSRPSQLCKATIHIPSHSSSPHCIWQGLVPGHLQLQWQSMIETFRWCMWFNAQPTFDSCTLVGERLEQFIFFSETSKSSFFLKHEKVPSLQVGSINHTRQEKVHRICKLSRECPGSTWIVCLLSFAYVFFKHSSQKHLLTVSDL